jgi:dCTP deaminase
MKVNGKVVELEHKNLKNKNRDSLGRGMVLSKVDIKKCLSSGDLIIKPFDRNSIGPCELDLHISENHARMKQSEQTLDLYKDIYNQFNNNKYFISKKSEDYIIEPNEHFLIESSEYLKVPTYLTALIGLRSTFSRLGFSTPPTLIDPGFKGKIVFHLIGSSYPVRLYAGMAVFKVVFMYVSSNTEAYNGKYQNQRGLMLAKRDPTWGRSK